MIGKLFPKPPFEMFDSKTGEYSDVPLMIGKSIGTFSCGISLP